MYGSSKRDVMYGFRGADLMRGYGRADSVNGDDRVEAVDGMIDVINCGNGNNDLVVFDKGQDNIRECEIPDPR